MADAKEKTELTPEEEKAKFLELSTQGIDAQAKAFLRGFVGEFSGRFEEVLDLAEEFKKYAPAGAASEARELEEDQAHLFLERRGETLTVAELRDYLRDMDIDKNHRVSFIEYCLWKYKHNIHELFMEKEGGMEALLKALDEAIALYQATLAERQAREGKMEQLKKDAEAGGVKGMKAKQELEIMLREDELERNKREITAGAKQRKAEKAVKEGDPYQIEQERLAAEKKKREAEEAAKRKESRERLAAKASLWK